MINKDDIIKCYLNFDTNNNSNNNFYEDNNPINLAYNEIKNENKNYGLKNDDDDNLQNKIIFNNETYYNNPYLMAFYASDSYLKYLLKIEMFPLVKKILLQFQIKYFQ